MRVIQSSSIKGTVVLVAFAVLGLSSGAQSPAEAPVATAVRAFLAAFNSGDQRELERFATERMALRQATPQEVAAQMTKDYQRTGGFEMQRLLVQTPTRATASVRTRQGGEAWQLQFEVEAAPPHRIVRFGVEAGGGGDEGRPDPTAGILPPAVKAGMTDTEMAKVIEDYLGRLAAADRFSGAALLAREGKILFKVAHGLADKGLNVANRTDTKFNLGSINKIFTLVALTELVAEGKLAWQDTIAKYLPDYPKPAGDRITIEQLTEHRSGLGDIFGPELDQAPRNRFRKPTDYFPPFASKPLLFEPGSSQGYSNAGFMVLGAVIERASGTDYFSFVRQRVYQPAGMTDTDAFEADRPVPNQAEGYIREQDGSYRSNVFVRLYKGSPAGGGYSTLDDLLRFTEAIRSGRLPLRGFSPGRAPRIAWAGGAPGTNSAVMLEGDYTLIVLSNYDPTIATAIASEVRKAIAAARPGLP
jgi:CubicO group peptidase (beta-lactamase class C family)